LPGLAHESGALRQLSFVHNCIFFIVRDADGQPVHDALGTSHYSQQTHLRRSVGVMRLLLLLSILTLSACAGQATSPLPTAWARGDGQAANSALLDIDSLDCKDEIQKLDGADNGKMEKAGYSRAMVEDFVSCMRAHGYVQMKG
jgi:hypothetical protein